MELQAILLENLEDLLQIFFKKVCNFFVFCLPVYQAYLPFLPPRAPRAISPDAPVRHAQGSVPPHRHHVPVPLLHRSIDGHGGTEDHNGPQGVRQIAAEVCR